MTHKHSVYDTDLHFIIDPVTRAVTSGANPKTKIIQYDHNSERFTFEIPRLVDGHDMTLCDKIEIHYINIAKGSMDKYADVYPVDDMSVSPDSDDTVIFSWLVSGNSTQYIGSLNFLIRFTCLTGDKIDYVWNTAICTTISISEGMYNAEQIAAEYSDVLAAWKTELTTKFAKCITHDQFEAQDQELRELIESAESDAKKYADEKIDDLSVEASRGKIIDLRTLFGIDYLEWDGRQNDDNQVLDHLSGGAPLSLSDLGLNDDLTFDAMPTMLISGYNSLPAYRYIEVVAIENYSADTIATTVEVTADLSADNYLKLTQHYSLTEGGEWTPSFACSVSLVPKANTATGVIDLNVLLESCFGGITATDFTPSIVKNDENLANWLSDAFSGVGFTSSDMHFFDAEMPIMRIVSTLDADGNRITREFKCIRRMLDYAEVNDYGAFYMDFLFGDLIVTFKQVGYMSDGEFMCGDPVEITHISPIGDIDKALDELHNYAQALIGGGA